MGPHGTAHRPRRPPDRVRHQLIQVHLWLREQLEVLRDDLESAPEGGRRRDLSLHCLAFCAAVGRHHGGEDAVAFPELAERFPELRPAGALNSLRRPDWEPSPPGFLLTSPAQIPR
jgi:hypothetical protein